MGRWDARLKIMAALIPAGSSVLDIGAGDGALRKFLAKHRYVATDKHPLVGVREWDVETPWPFGREHYDYAVLSGVLERVFSPKDTLLVAAALADKVIVSYDHAGSLVYREAHDFTNHFSRAGVEREFRSAGWGYRVASTYKHQVIYELWR